MRNAWISTTFPLPNFSDISRANASVASRHRSSIVYNVVYILTSSSICHHLGYDNGVVYVNRACVQKFVADFHIASSQEARDTLLQAQRDSKIALDLVGLLSALSVTNCDSDQPLASITNQ